MVTDVGADSRVCPNDGKTRAHTQVRHYKNTLRNKGGKSLAFLLQTLKAGYILWRLGMATLMPIPEDIKPF